jgi:hypothetical protein
VRIVAAEAGELQGSKRFVTIAIRSEYTHYDLIHRRPSVSFACLSG